MDRKNDFNEIVKKYQPVMKKTGEQLAKAIKNAEEDISKMYKIAQAHVEIQMKNLQKEKIYHELGKYIAQKIMDDNLDIPGIEKYKKQLSKLTSESNKKKKVLSRVNNMRKRRKTAKKTGSKSK